MRAVIVFWDPDEARWKWALKPGFRHVFCILADGDYWIAVDSRLAQPAVEVVGGTTYDIAAHYRREPGFTVVEWNGAQQPWRSPMAMANCTGLVKAMLGIRAWWAQSPYQLWKYLVKEQRHALRPARPRRFAESSGPAASSAPAHD